MTYAQQMPGLLQKGKADTQDCKAWVDEQLSEMSLKEKIGQLFIHTVEIGRASCRERVLRLV